MICENENDLMTEVKQRLTLALHEAMAAFNEADEGTMVVPSEYLEVVATKL